MSVSSIDEEVMQLGGNVSHGTMEDDLIMPMEEGQRSGGSSKLLEMLKAETGSGSVESYLTHPMNFNESKGLARMLRGFTGMFGSLNFAVIDIIIGGLDLMKNSRKAGDNYDVSSRSDLYT